MCDFLIDNHDIGDDIVKLIKDQNIDIVCLQEFHNKKEGAFSYPYKYFKYNSTTNRVGQAILSKYPIINNGSLNFSRYGNNAIFADIVKGKDTIRVYNLHLQSFHINPKQAPRYLRQNRKFRCIHLLPGRCQETLFRIRSE